MRDQWAGRGDGREVAVLDAAGRLGAAVVRALLDRAVRVVRADATDPADLPAALTGVRRLVAVSAGRAETPYAASAAGKAVARAACAAGVERVVYCSAAGADRHTGIDDLETHRRVELAYLSLQSSSLMRVSLLRPVLLMEDLAARVTVADDEVVVRLPLPPDRPLPLVAADDVASCAAALVTADGVPEVVELAGDELTGPELARAYGEHLARPARYQEVTLSSLPDAAERTRWAWPAGPSTYGVDLAAASASVPGLRDLRTWLREREPAVGDDTGSR